MAADICHNGQHAAEEIIAVNAVNAIGNVVVGLAQSIGTNGAVHGPRRQTQTVEGQGQEQTADIHVVHVVCAQTIGIARVVVVVGARPERRQGHIVIDGITGRNGREVRAQDRRAVKRHIGCLQALNAHAQAQIRTGNRPVQEGALDLDDGAVGAHGRATLRIVSLAPDALAYFKIDFAHEVFGSHGIQLQTHTRTRFKLVFRIVVAGMALVGEVAVLPVLKVCQPDALGLEVHCRCLLRRAQDQRRRQ